MAHEVLFNSVAVSTDSSHATEVKYSLPSGYRRFHARVGVADSANSSTSITFQVAGGGRSLGSLTATAGQRAKPFDVNVTGISDLSLIVTSNGSDYHDAVFGNARLLASGEAPPQPPAPPGRALADLTAVDGDPGVGDAQVAHEVLFNSVAVSTDSSHATEVKYSLPSGYRRFHARVGVADSANSSTSITFQVAGGGRSLGSLTATAGQRAKPFDVNVTGISDLSLIVTSNGSDYHDAVFGNARLLLPE